ncbi:uncharacterized protein TNCV_4187671 [Trichonephila clavipes]|nr:uncharacterized protein TNCV_4187671 [Trichonephila clavipes]
MITAPTVGTNLNYNKRFLNIRCCNRSAVCRIQCSSRHRATQFELLIQCSGSSVRPEILQGIRTSADENKTPENQRKLAGICLRSRKARQLGFLRSPNNCDRNNLFTVFRGRPEVGGNSEGCKNGRCTRSLIYTVICTKIEAATQAIHKDRHFIRGARVTEEEPCESQLLKEMDILKEEMQTIKAGISNHEKRNFRCWGCGGTGHLGRNCPRSRKDDNTVSSSK